MRRTALLVAAAVLLLPSGGISAQDGNPAPADADSNAPNVVVVMTDDQRYDDMAGMPRTKRVIGSAGVSFKRAFVSYPVCCPSRATFLTGQYAHNNHVICLYRACGGGYTALRQDEYLPVWMERAGYVTAHIGKFLNGYGKDRAPDKPKGWTDWEGLIDHSTYRMWGYSIFDNDHRVTYGKVRSEDPRLYQTDVLTKRALEFIGNRVGGDKPFFLSLAYLAPHHESGRTQALTGKLVRPAPRHRGAYAGVPLPPMPAYNEADVSDKPSFLPRFNPPLRSKRQDAILKRFHERRESLLAVDEGVQKIVRKLRDMGELENTYVIFTSDHGFMQGEHRIPQGKMEPYDPSTQVPLLIRGPGLPHGRSTKALVGNMDLAPTILSATRATSPFRLDGRSILPYARNVHLRNLRPLLHETVGQGAHGRTNTREGGTKGTQPRVPAWAAVRTTRWLYVEYQGGQRELYNLTRDRYQLNSVVDDPRRRRETRTLRRILQDLKSCRGRRCDKLASAAVG